MRKIRILLILGVWAVILPYLGFPYSWKDVLFTLTGLVLVGLSYLIYKDYKAEQGFEKSFDNFKENGDAEIEALIEESR